jgi:hypothetical protein
MAQHRGIYVLLQQKIPILMLRSFEPFGGSGRNILSPILAFVAAVVRNVGKVAQAPIRRGRRAKSDDDAVGTDRVDDRRV